MVIHVFFDLVESKFVVGRLYKMHNVTNGCGDNGRVFRHLDELGSYNPRIKESSASISVGKKLRVGAAKVRKVDNAQGAA